MPERDDSDPAASENTGNSARLVEPDIGVNPNSMTSLALEGDDKLVKHLPTHEALDAPATNKTDVPFAPDPRKDHAEVRVKRPNL